MYGELSTHGSTCSQCCIEAGRYSTIHKFISVHIQFFFHTGWTDLPLFSSMTRLFTAYQQLSVSTATWGWVELRDFSGKPQGTCPDLGLYNMFKEIKFEAFLDVILCLAWLFN